MTFTLPGFATVKRERLIVSGTAVIAVDARHARRRRAGDDHRHRRNAGRRRRRAPGARSRSTTRPCETCRASRSYSYLLTTVPGLQTNINNVNTGPVFAIFPIHGGRGVESRLTVDGLNISNPPGGNQPPNYVADVGNATEVTMTTSGGLGEIGDRRPHDEHRPEAGRQHAVGPGVRLRLLEGDAVEQLRRRADGARRHPAEPRVSRLRRQRRGRRADRQGQALVLHERPRAGAAAEHAEPYLQQERGQPERVDATWRISTSRRSRIARGRTTRPASRGRRRSATSSRSSWDEQPICRKCTGTTSFSGSPSPTTSPEADGLGEFNPQRVQQVRWTSPMTNKLLLEAGLRHQLLPVGRQGARPEPDPRSGARVNIGQIFVPARRRRPRSRAT